MLEAASEQPAQVGGVERAAHPLGRAGDGPLGAFEIATLGGRPRQLPQYLAAALASHLDQKPVLALEDLGQREVVAGLDSWSRLHRGAEAGAAGLEAVDGDDEGVLAASGVVALDLAALEEDRVLNRDRMQLARAHAEKGEWRVYECLLLDVEATVAPPLRLPETHVRGQQELLPGMRADGVSEARLVVAALEPVAARVLGVGPTDGELGSRFELVVDDRALSHRRPEHAVTATSERTDEDVECLWQDHACLDVGQGRPLSEVLPSARAAYIAFHPIHLRVYRSRLAEFPLAVRPALGEAGRVLTKERRRFRVRGVVQGVGFRPFVYRLARQHRLGGFVLNDGHGVLIEAEGDAAALDAFASSLHQQAPALARIETVTAELLSPSGESDFAVIASRPTGASALIPPDVATCEDCLRELFDPTDRRFRYPFINCTQCGPRFTIVRSVPYDRPSTTMAGFPMCTDCRREYADPSDRRFHAEPIACPACGPRLSLPLEEAIGLLRAGAILAVKGLGGYHLACDAGSEEVVARLRSRKRREEKPFALMTAEPDALAVVSSEEWALLRSPARPIVLLPRRSHAPLGLSVAPETPWLGVMLPYTPLHHLLASDFGRPLVMTSGNQSDEPIAFDDAEARSRLSSIADAFLSHDRPIHRRCEDSVVRAMFPVRRSRGYAPSGLPLPIPAERPIVAAGAELKSTFCVARGASAFLSPHLGDLDSEPAYRAYRADLELYLEMLGVEPEVIAHDLHPEYLATKWAFDQDAELIGVQHHHAHAAACLAEHGEQGPALALVFDGTGYGTDGTLWGGELLRCDLAKFERLAHLEPVPLPGGDAAIRQPWRIAAVHLERASRPVPFERWPLVRESLKLDPPLSSGMGRLFDAVAALLGVREEVSYEGQAAIELEHLAGSTEAEPYAWRFGDGTALVRAVHDDLAAGRPRAEIAAAFHEAVAAAAAEACAEAGEPRVVVLSGGSFQNLRLLGSTRRRLEALGFRVLSHRLVPPNDGGVSFGQAAVAARRVATCA